MGRLDVRYVLLVQMPQEPDHLLGVPLVAQRFGLPVHIFDRRLLCPFLVPFGVERLDLGTGHVLGVLTLWYLQPEHLGDLRHRRRVTRLREADQLLDRATGVVVFEPVEQFLVLAPPLPVLGVLLTEPPFVVGWAVRPRRAGSRGEVRGRLRGRRGWFHDQALRWGCRVLIHDRVCHHWLLHHVYGRK